MNRPTYLVVNALIEILNKNIALAGLAEGRVTLRPHDAAINIDQKHNMVEYK